MFFARMPGYIQVRGDHYEQQAIARIAVGHEDRGACRSASGDEAPIVLVVAIAPRPPHTGSLAASEKHTYDLGEFRDDNRRTMLMVVERC